MTKHFMSLIFMSLTASCWALDWNSALFERNVQILGLCPDFGNPDEPDGPPTPSPSAAPTAVPRVCNTNVGSGVCLDANGNAYDSCAKFANPLSYSRGKCREAAESVPNSVGWQYGLSGSLPLACVVYFDDVDSQNDVKPLCPEGFGILTTSSNTGTGFPQAGGEGLLGCYSYIMACSFEHLLPRMETGKGFAFRRWNFISKTPTTNSLCGICITQFPLLSKLMVCSIDVSCGTWYWTFVISNGCYEVYLLELLKSFGLS